MLCDGKFRKAIDSATRPNPTAGLYVVVVVLLVEACRFGLLRGEISLLPLRDFEETLGRVFMAMQGSGHAQIP
jgi:hypothetical protein